MTPPDATPSPLVSNLRISSLHIRNLKAIQSLDLPEQGLGWSERIPDVVLVGGANGSGKTTLLELFNRVFEVFELTFIRRDSERLEQIKNSGFRGMITTVGIDFRFLIGENRASGHLIYKQYEKILELEGYDKHHWQYSVETRDSVKINPAFIYFPSGRALTTIPTEFKMAGLLIDPTDFVYVWRSPEKWQDSLEAVLYGAEWADYHAKKAGEKAPGIFDAYADEFHYFMNRKKRLKWTTKGELVIETENGEHHSLDELSSGEKQILVMMTELKRRWRPGSLVLIDEPELHLHETLQTKLYERIVELQKERGGQVWLATQSNHLFKIAAPYTKVLLEPPLVEMGVAGGLL